MASPQVTTFFVFFGGGSLFFFSYVSELFFFNFFFISFFLFFRSHHGETQFLVNASLVEQITDILTNESLPYEVLVDDFQTVVDDEMKQIQDSSENFKFRNPGDVPDPRKQFNLFNYHRLDDIYQYLNQVIISKLVDTVLQF